MKTGYSIKTWRMRLFCPEQDMLAKTEQLYQETVDFYYEILQTRQDIWKENLLSIQERTGNCCQYQAGMEEYPSIHHLTVSCLYTSADLR